MLKSWILDIMYVHFPKVYMYYFNFKQQPLTEHWPVSVHTLNWMSINVLLCPLCVFTVNTLDFTMTCKTKKSRRHSSLWVGWYVYLWKWFLYVQRVRLSVTASDQEKLFNLLLISLWASSSGDMAYRVMSCRETAELRKRAWKGSLLWTLTLHL